jgi:hypothetical protein
MLPCHRAGFYGKRNDLHRGVGTLLKVFGAILDALVLQRHPKGPQINTVSMRGPIPTRSFSRR